MCMFEGKREREKEKREGRRRLYVYEIGQGEEIHFSVLIFFPRLGTGLTSKVDRARTFIRTNYIM